MRRSSVLAVLAVLVAVTLAGAGAGAGAPALAAGGHPAARPARAEKGGTYTARFTDASGHPLAGVVASADAVDDVYGDDTSTVTSGHNGRVTLPLPAGRYFVFADGSHAMGGVSDATGYVGTSRDVRIGAGRNWSSGTIALASGGAVRVHVVDNDGQPVVGAHPDLSPVRTYVQPDENDSSFLFAFFDGTSTYPRTDTDGDVTLVGVPTSAAYQVCVDPGGAEYATDADIESACTSTSTLPRAGRFVTAPTLTVQRRSGGSLAGRLTDRAGHGFPHSSIDVWRGDELVDEVQSTAGGRFRVAGLKPATYRVCADYGPFLQLGRTGYQPRCAAHRKTIESATDTASVSIVLPLGAAAAGTVTGPHGAPVDGASVTPTRDGIGAVGTQTDSQGRFVLKGLPAGRNTLCADVDPSTATKRLPFGVLGGCSRSRRHVTSRVGRVSTGLDLQLPVAAAASGTVVDGRGHPVPGAEIEQDGESKGTFDDPAYATSDARGRFTLAGMVPGRYRVCAETVPGFAAADISGSGVRGCRHGTITVHAGHLRAGVRIVLPTTAAVLVTAVDGSGHGVAGVDATVVAACHGDCDAGTPVLPRKRTSVVSTGTTGGHGSVLLDGLRPGHYAVCLFAFYGTTRTGSPGTGYADRCVGSTFTVDVRAGHTTAKRVVLHAGGSVSGRITDANGDPLAGVLVHVAGSAADDLPESDLEFPQDPEGGGSSAVPGYFSTTAADGTYTVRSVRPGDRLVCADPTGATGGPSKGGYLPQCVGGRVGSTRKGAPVTVRGGQVSAGVGLSLSAGGGIGGTVTAATSTDETDVLLLQSGSVIDQVEPHSSGAYHVSGLAPGTYSVCVDSFGSRAEHGACYDAVAWDPDSGPPPSDATPVTVVAGVRTAGIDISVR